MATKFFKKKTKPVEPEPKVEAAKVDVIVPPSPVEPEPEATSTMNLSRREAVANAFRERIAERKDR